MKTRRYEIVKRSADIAVAVSAGFALSPVLLMTAIAVRLKLGSPVLFRQERPGKDAQPFELVKFRSMTDETNGSGEPLSDEARLTSFGLWLRSTSLDELPELLNVLRGDMSVVGPRPLLMRYLERYSPEQARRHEVRPGLTGWAQVNGRNATDWTERFQQDVWYVDNRSISLDLKIVLRTVGSVLRRKGITDSVSVTMEEFT